MRKSPTAKRRMTRHRFDYCNDHGKHIPPPAIAVEAAHFHEPTQNNEQVFSAIADLCTAVMCSKRKSSAVAESDRARANRAQIGGTGAAVPLSVRELGLHLTQCRLGRGLPQYQVVSLSIQIVDHNRHGPKSGGCCALFRAWGSWVPI